MCHFERSEKSHTSVARDPSAALGMTHSVSLFGAMILRRSAIHQGKSMRPMFYLAPVAAALLVSQAHAQEPRDYYLYQRAAAPSALHVDFETATGTRDAGVFGRHGMEGL